MQWKRTSTRVNECTETFAEIDRQSTVWRGRSIAVRDEPWVLVVARPGIRSNRLSLLPADPEFWCCWATNRGSISHLPRRLYPAEVCNDRLRSDHTPFGTIGRDRAAPLPAAQFRTHLNWWRLITSRVSSSSDRLTRIRFATMPSVTETNDALSSTAPITSDCK